MAAGRKAAASINEYLETESWESVDEAAEAVNRLGGCFAPDS
jgi:hypothetical protein